MTGLAWLEARRREWAAQWGAYSRWRALTPGQQLDSGFVYHGSPPSLARYIHQRLTYKPTARDRVFERVAAWDRSPTTWQTADGRILSATEFSNEHLFCVLRMMHSLCYRHSVPYPKVYDLLSEEALKRGLHSWSRRYRPRWRESDRQGQGIYGKD